MEILSLVKVITCIQGPFLSDHAVVACYLSLKKENMLRKVISIRLEEYHLWHLCSWYGSRWNHWKQSWWYVRSSQIQDGYVSRHSCINHYQVIHCLHLKSLEHKGAKRAEEKRRKKIWYKYWQQHQCHALTNERKRYKAMLSENKTKCSSEKIKDCSNDTKKLYGLVYCLTGRKADNYFPEHTDLETMANAFVDYFIGKIKKICASLEDSPKYIPRSKSKGVLSNFKSITEEDLIRTINGMSSKSCECDAIPIGLL